MPSYFDNRLQGLIAKLNRTGSGVTSLDNTYDQAYDEGYKAAKDTAAKLIKSLLEDADDK